MVVQYIVSMRIWCPGGSGACGDRRWIKRTCTLLMNPCLKESSMHATAKVFRLFLSTSFACVAVQKNTGPNLEVETFQSESCQVDTPFQTIPKLEMDAVVLQHHTQQFLRDHLLLFRQFPSWKGDRFGCILFQNVVVVVVFLLVF